MNKIGLVFGGKSHEHDVSRVSALSFLKNIDLDCYNITPFYITKDGSWVVYEELANNILSFDELVEVEKCRTPPVFLLRSMDLVFPLIHGETGEDGKIQGFFEMCDIEYIGCGVESSAIGMNKVVAKELAQRIAHVNVVPSVVVQKKQPAQIDVDTLSYPLFVKPARAGSSIGVTKVKDCSELQFAVDRAFQIDDIVLIEKSIVGREIEVAVVGDEVLRVSQPGEVTFTSDFYDYENKYHSDNSQMHIPANLSSELKETFREKAKLVYRALGCRGYARIDFFLEEDTNEIFFNEINTSPGFTEKSMFPSLFNTAGYDFSDLLKEIIDSKIIGQQVFSATNEEGIKYNER